MEHSGVPILLELEPHIEGTWDRLRLDQVITNLVSNGIKYGTEKPIVISASVNGNQVTVRVQDHGMGVLPEDVARIFERFVRAGNESTNRGIGMGIWIVKQKGEATGWTIRG